MSGSPGAGGEGKRTFLIRFFGLSFLVLLTDQFSKFLALHYLVPGRSLPLVENVFHLTLVHNPGIAFGLFQEHEGILFFLISVSMIVLMLIGVRMQSAPAAARIGFALILGGAAGNWIDRLRYQAVVDFLDFRIWPVFNLADTAISVGVGLYLLLLFFQRDPAPDRAGSPGEAERES